MNQTDNPKWIFSMSFFGAFLVHCSMFFGGAMGVNEDNFTIYRRSTNAAYGRWFCDVLNKIGIPGSYLSQSWIGIFVILALALLCTVVLTMIKVKNTSSALLIMAVLVVFPTLAYGYGFLRDAVFYAFSLMLAALAVYVANKWKYGWVVGAFLIMLSLALYQAWIAFAAAFSMSYILVQLKENLFSPKQLMILVLRNAAMGLGGILFYLVSVKIYNRIFHITLGAYKGLNSMGNISFKDLMERFINCYDSFSKYLNGQFYFMPKPIMICNIAILILCLLFCAYTFISKIRMKKYFEAVFFLGFVVLLPVGMFLMDIAAGANDTLSIYAVCLLYVFFIKCCDDLLEKNKKIFSIGAYMTGIVMVAFFFFITQIYYFKIHVFYQRSFAIANRMLMQIEELEEYPQIRKVALGGSLRATEEYGKSEVMFDDVIMNDRSFVGQYVGLNTADSDYGLVKFVSFMNGFLGSNFESVKINEVEQRLKTEEYAQMPLWPHKGSIKVIDNIIIIKMEDYCWVDVEETGGEYNFYLQSNKEDHRDVFYVWQLFKDGIEISNYIGTNSNYKTVCDVPGTYFTRVYVKDAESNEVLHKVFSDKITIEETIE